MKKIALTAILASLMCSAFAIDLDKEDSKISYTVGTQIGGTLKNNLQGPIDLNEKAVFEGITDALSGKDLQLKPEEMDAAMKEFAKKSGEYAKKQAEEAAGKNQAEGKKLLEENRAKDGVKVTDSGLQYRVLKDGKGKNPKATDTVKVNYKGTLADGTTFDSSYDRGEPAKFPLNAVIPGWTEGLQLMSEGSKYEFVIPSELAYGPQGPGAIGPDRVLIFEVELLAINTTEAKEAPKATEAKEAPKATEAKEAPKATEAKEAPKAEKKDD